MKTLFISLLLLTTVATFANDGKYFDEMAKNIEAVYNGKTAEEIQAAINTLDRVGAAEKTKWEPYYYASFGYVMLATREKENSKKDSYLDLATEEIKKASEILPNESEIVTMEGFIYMIRTSVDPATRGQKYSTLAMQSFNKALALNENNPRALGMMAQLQFGIARFFSAPTTEACATTKQSLEKFATFKSDNPLAPVWGKGATEELLSQCK